MTEPILDVASGRVLNPEQLRPGVIARVASTGESLRVTRVDVNADDGIARLTLGSSRVTLDSLIGRIAKRWKVSRS